MVVRSQKRWIKKEKSFLQWMPLTSGIHINQRNNRTDGPTHLKSVAAVKNGVIGLAKVELYFLSFFLSSTSFFYFTGLINRCSSIRPPPLLANDNSVVDSSSKGYILKQQEWWWWWWCIKSSSSNNNNKKL